MRKEPLILCDLRPARGCRLFHSEPTETGQRRDARASDYFTGISDPISADLVTQEGLQKCRKPILKIQAKVIQPYGSVTSLPLGLTDNARTASIVSLNQVLADTMTLRDLYKKHHWQVSGVTFYQLHLLLDKHYGEQATLVDSIAERVQTLGGRKPGDRGRCGRTDPNCAPSPRTRRCTCSANSPSGSSPAHLDLLATSSRGSKCYGG